MQYGDEKYHGNGGRSERVESHSRVHVRTLDKFAHISTQTRRLGSTMACINIKLAVATCTGPFQVGVGRMSWYPPQLMSWSSDVVGRKREERRSCGYSRSV